MFVSVILRDCVWKLDLLFSQVSNEILQIYLGVSRRFNLACFRTCDRYQVFRELEQRILVLMVQLAKSLFGKPGRLARSFLFFYFWLDLWLTLGSGLILGLNSAIASTSFIVLNFRFRIRFDCCGLSFLLRLLILLKICCIMGFLIFLHISPRLFLNLFISNFKTRLFAVSS